MSELPSSRDLDLSHCRHSAWAAYTLHYEEPVEPINLDDVVDLAGDLDAGTYLPAPADLMPKGTSGSTWFDVCLGLLPEEPIKEPLQGEESAAVVTLTCRGGATFWAFPSLVPGSVAAVLYQSCIA